MSPTNSRNIKEEEKLLITSILELVGIVDRISSIPEVVHYIDDDSIETIKFTNEESRVFGDDIAQVQYIDSDNIPVIITLTTDNRNELFELKFWKVNFEKLQTYPKPNEIRII